MKILLTLCALVLSFPVYALELSKPVPAVTLEEKNGGRLDGTAWSSEELKGKVSVIFYVDPDHKDRNEAFSSALSERKLPREKFQSVAIINMKATWKPNFAIRSALRKKQKKYPHTLYLQDKEKHLVKEWGVKHDDSDIIVTDVAGNVLYFFYGKMNEEEINKALSIIETALK